ncbi:MAG TPA: helix-turn-helix transcriptional regulator [Coriobacteriia bacterium]|nr:helix-turn-helix transcriptional regulator [Coriobacteriia bacterium]
MSSHRGMDDRSRPLYMISVAAELAGMHPQTLRIYERRRLVSPQRSAGNTRLYSQADVERLRVIQHLTQVEGVNLSGVERILELEREVERLTDEMGRLRRQAEQLRARVAEVARAECATGIVMVRSGTLARRSGWCPRTGRAEEAGE